MKTPFFYMASSSILKNISPTHLMLTHPPSQHDGIGVDDDRSYCIMYMTIIAIQDLIEDSPDSLKLSSVSIVTMERCSKTVNTGNKTITNYYTCLSVQSLRRKIDNSCGLLYYIQSQDLPVPTEDRWKLLTS